MKTRSLTPFAWAWTRALLALGVCAACGFFVPRAATDEPSPAGPSPAAENGPPTATASAAEKLAQIKLPDVTLPSVDGFPTPLRSLRGPQATVLVFQSTHCPISNGYLPTLHALAADYAEKGVKLIGLNPNSGQSLKEMSSHRHEYQVRIPLLRDASGHLAAALGVEVCPEVCVFDDQDRLRYRGRIDDRYLRRGGAALEVKEETLKAALDAILAGEDVPVPVTNAVGCPVARDLPPAPKDSEKAPVTYTKQVSRILQKHCQTCHREGGIGPFTLTSYEDAVAWAEDLVRFTQDRTMPPWKPVAGFGTFNSPRDLSPEELEFLKQWVAAGCPRGDKRDAPDPAEFTDGWSLGEPDIILTPSEAYTLSADGPDVYRCFVLPTNYDEDKSVVALEVLPGNRRVVHHVIAFLDTSGAAAALDEKAPGPGYSTSAGFPGFFPRGGLGGWAPGNTPDRLPRGMAKILPRGAHIVMQVHYHKTGKEETDQTRLGLYLSQVPVTRSVFVLPVAPPGGPLSGMRIPAGDPNYEVRAALVLQRDYLAIGITPHMHLLGKDMRVTATLPDGRLEPLIHIENWDFAWQESYQYRAPLNLPKGTKIEVSAHFNNSAKNPANPSRPPRDVHWGEQTNDEMCIAFLEVTPAVEARSPAELQPPVPGQVLQEVLRGQFGENLTLPFAPGELTPEVILRLRDFYRRNNQPQNHSGSK